MFPTVSNTLWLLLFRWLKDCIFGGFNVYALSFVLMASMFILLYHYHFIHQDNYHHHHYHYHHHHHIIIYRSRIRFPVTEATYMANWEIVQRIYEVSSLLWWSSSTSSSTTTTTTSSHHYHSSLSSWSSLSFHIETASACQLLQYLDLSRCSLSL